jgi:hypothetical protein
MYQPYPGGNNPYARRPPAPPSVQNAVKFMYAGAALSLISTVVSLTAVRGIKRVFEQSSMPVTAGQLNEIVAAMVGVLIVIGLIALPDRGGLSVPRPGRRRGRSRPGHGRRPACLARGAPAAAAVQRA